MSAPSSGNPAERPAFGRPGRIQSPNSTPRTLALVGLGDGGAAVARDVAREGHERLDVHVLAKSASADALAAIQAGGGDLHRDLMRADMIFLVACRGDDASLAPVVSRIAHRRSHPVTALYIVPPGEAAEMAEDETLRTLRSGVEMLVVVSDRSYVPAMIHALAA
jgi:cell division GTPase FtsZ